MATKKTEAATKTEETALATTAPTAMAAPDFIEQGSAGTENISGDDLLLPRLALAQKMSPEVDEMQPEKFIDGLKAGMLFNNISKEVYGKGPLNFIVLRIDRPRGIQFKPMEEGGGIIDFNVPLNDPRMLWGADGSKPVATKFYDFVVMLYAPGEAYHGDLIVLSLKSTGVKVAKRLNTLVTTRKKDGRPVPCFAGLYAVKTGVAQSPQGPYATYEVDNAGWYPDAETYAKAKELFAMVATKNIEVEREPGGDDDPDSFNHGDNANGGGPAM